MSGRRRSGDLYYRDTGLPRDLLVRVAAPVRKWLVRGPVRKWKVAGPVAKWRVGPPAPRP